MREVIGVRGRERSGEERGGTDGEGRKGGGRDGDTGLMGGERGGEGRREGGRRRVYKREEGAEMGIHTDYRIANLLQSTTHQRPICASPSHRFLFWLPLPWRSTSRVRLLALCVLSLLFLFHPSNLPSFLPPFNTDTPQQKCLRDNQGSSTCDPNAVAYTCFCADKAFYNKIQTCVLAGCSLTDAVGE